MTTVYLCIGTPKTGTTALQSFMRENEKLINEQGYSFPYMDLGILPIFRDRNAHFLVHQSELPTPEEREKEFETVRANGYKIVAEEAKKYKNIILTDELVWNRCNEIENFWPDLIENFKRMNCEIKVVVYLRRQDLIIQSLWNQHVKVARRIWKTFRECIYGEYFNYFPLDYYAQLSKIAQYVKKENMIVRPYEKGQFEENSIHADFFKAVGLSLTDAFTREKVEPNVGLKGNYIEIKRILNCVETYREMDDFMRRPVLNASKCQDSLEPYPQESMFTYEEQIEYMKRFEESNQKVAKEFLHREDGVLFYGMWKGYMEQPQLKDFIEFMKNKGVKLHILHTSGHADSMTIDKLIKKVKPKFILPVHTENAEWFNRYNKNILISNEAKVNI